MVRVGVVGLGMMGLTHLDVYRQRKDVQIVAICDSDRDRLSGKVHAAGNVEGQAQSSVADLEGVQRLTDIFQVIGNPEIDVVDICLPTDLHVRFGCEVLHAGQHLMIEKPLARYAADAAQLCQVAEQSKGITFVGQCMRFWPGWTWLREAMLDNRFGKLYSAKFQRLASHPGGPFYSNGQRSGGAALDLHIHDTDFVQFCLGMPRAVTSVGYSKITTEPDHLLTHYHYDHVPMVVAEGSWAMAEGYSFNMAFEANFERATAVYSLAAKDPLMLYQPGQSPSPVALPATTGYELEIANMLDCVQRGVAPTVVTVQDAMNTIRIIEAEVESVRSGKTVTL
jgi:predicted dehydrogenase